MILMKFGFDAETDWKVIDKQIKYETLIKKF